VSCVCISPNDKHLITAHRSLLMKQWDNWRKSNEHGKTNKCTRTWKSIHTAPVQFMCFDSSSTLLASASSDFTVKVWDINAQYCTHNLKGATGIVRCVRFYPQIEQVQQCVTGGEDGKLRVYNLRTSNMDACLEAHFSSITCFEYIYNETSARYDKLCSSSRDKVIIVWDLQTFTKQRTVPIYESIESFLMLSQVFDRNEALDRFVITMGNQGVLKLWDIKTGRLLNKQAESESFKLENRKNKSEQESSDELVIIQSDYHAKLNRLTLVTSDQLVVFVEIDKTRLEQSLICNQKELNVEESLFHVRKQFIGDHGEILDTQLCGQNLLAMATNSPLVKLYNMNTWDCKLLKGHTDLVICLSVFLDKHRTFLASSSKDSTIRIWQIKHVSESDTSSYECVATLNGHTQDVGALDFSNLAFDFLVSGSIDTTVKLWRITRSSSADHEYVFNVAYTIRAHEKDINGLCVSPNDRLIASCSSDKTAKV
jgi:U3 small nucleolar RNA-associated protein 13